MKTTELDHCDPELNDGQNNIATLIIDFFYVGMCFVCMVAIKHAILRECKM